MAIRIHTINDKEVNIDWEEGEVIDNHGSGCVDRQVKGEDDHGNCYEASANYQGDELIEVYDIEQVS